MSQPTPVTPDTLIRPEVRALGAYRVVDATGLVKLDAMENPYPWPGDLTDAWLARLRDTQLNRYPDPAAAELKQRLRETLQIPAGAELLLGNGSDELIQILITAVGGREAVVMSVDPSFVMYRQIAGGLGMRYVGVPLTADFQLDPSATLTAIEQHRPRVVFLAYPNNPTGNLFDIAAVREIIAATPGLVVLDEAYSAFSGKSFLGRVLDHPNLLVMRTVSKLGLAGLRLGFLVGRPDWLSQLDKLRLPYNINTLTQVSAEFALSNMGVLEQQARKIAADREGLAAAMAALPGLTVFPSQANFILFRVPRGTVDVVFEGLRARGILVKNVSAAGSALSDCLRVTVGSPAETAGFLQALTKCLA